jgi:hypothetical protein
MILNFNYNFVSNHLSSATALRGTVDLILHRSPTPMPTSLNPVWSVGVVSLIAIAVRRRSATREKNRYYRQTIKIEYPIQ